jgi:hypothetical protein
MGCKLVRSETIYFIRHAGRTSGADLESDWFRAETDHRLLPAIYVRSDGYSAPAAHTAAFPIEIRTFEGS